MTVRTAFRRCALALCFSLAKPIARLMGQTGINVMTRLMRRSRSPTT